MKICIVEKKTGRLKYYGDSGCKEIEKDTVNYECVDVPQPNEFCIWNSAEKKWTDSQELHDEKKKKDNARKAIVFLSKSSLYTQAYEERGYLILNLLYPGLTQEITLQQYNELMIFNENLRKLIKAPSVNFPTIPAILE